ncbi:sucrose-6-phosphate hydrolase [Alkalicoccus halolimnae]|uniref:Sucrose-6-phosphate hydrolase n=1 Tax=Alkalicoccus halolimnae TaxID=1667239 RepID=A0A5C7F9V6_9BACI|nr:sucrose-6-phosphate hydrolase [Alkalicoccus halolimnae]TXF86883.1 sucrose-6-phosphate hydrolase [Alkalicoccus halolimnae]
MTEKEKQLHEAAYEAVEKNKSTVEGDPYRQAYHLMPPAGLLNDPNGWIQWKGTYHMFFQWNPFSPDHTHKFWGHFTSDDLIEWKEEPIALAPSEWYEKNGCYSGSAIELDDKLALIYTGNVKDENNNREAYQCVAASEDGVHFEKQGPVVDTLPEGYTADFRDPKVWKENGRYYFVIGAKTTEKKGQVLLYRSDDFKKWELVGPLAGSGLNGLGPFGYMWECPDLFSLNEKEVLIVSPQGLEKQGRHFENTYQAGYFLGNADLEKASYSHGEFRELDQGFEFYAPQTTVDKEGRRILFGWMGVPDSDEEFQPTVGHQWIHCLTIPRIITVDGDKIRQEPAKELENLRVEEALELRVDTAKGAEVVITEASEMVIDTAQAEDLYLTFRNEASFFYDASEKLVTFTRPRFRDGEIETRQCHLDTLERLHIFMDYSSLEIFMNNGETVMTSRFFPNPADNTVEISGNAGSITWKSWELK